MLNVFVLTFTSQNTPVNESAQIHCCSVTFTTPHVPLLMQGDGTQGAVGQNGIHMYIRTFTNFKLCTM